MLTRVPRTSAAVLSHVFEVGEVATDSTSTVTVTVTDANGTVVTSGNATHPGPDGVYQFALPGQSALKLLSVAWSATIAGASVVEVDEVEVVGGFFFSLSEGRGSDPSLSDTGKYPTADLVDKRTEVEQECEMVCDRAFVPRYARVVVDGTGHPDLVLPHPDPGRTVAHVRSVRRVSMAPRADEPFTDFTVAELAAVRVSEDGTLRRLDEQVFTEGFGNVVVEYEYGLSAPPEDLQQAALRRFRSRLNMNKTGIPDRATSFTLSDGGAFRISMPGAWATGIPEVDAAYARYSRRDGAGGRKVPASRTLSYDPQFTSLMHPGRR